MIIDMVLAIGFGSDVYKCFHYEWKSAVEGTLKLAGTLSSMAR